MCTKGLAMSAGPYQMSQPTSEHLAALSPVVDFYVYHYVMCMTRMIVGSLGRRYHSCWPRTEGQECASFDRRMLL